MERYKLRKHKKEVEELLLKGFNYEVIAGHFQVSRQAIGLFARQYHLRKQDLGLKKSWHSKKAKKDRYIIKQGYIMVWDGEKYLLEHRHIMSQIIGRPLLRQEVVHHINGDRTDNRPENLALMPSQKKHNLFIACINCTLQKENIRLKKELNVLKKDLQKPLTI